MYQPSCSFPWSNFWGKGFFFTSARNVISADALRSVRKKSWNKGDFKQIFFGRSFRWYNCFVHICQENLTLLPLCILYHKQKFLVFFFLNIGLYACNCRYTPLTARLLDHNLSVELWGFNSYNGLDTGGMEWALPTRTSTLPSQRNHLPTQNEEWPTCWKRRSDGFDLQDLRWHSRGKSLSLVSFDTYTVDLQTKLKYWSIK